MIDRSKESAPVPRRMKALRLHTPSGPSGLALDEVETPEPAAGEVLVRVQAAAITRDELDWPTDRLPAIPSYEFAGEVLALGAGVSGIAAGELIYALSPFNRNGAAAEYAVVVAKHLALRPRTLTDVESAAIPLAALTAWQGLMEHGRLSQGQRVLIHGATGGVGNYAAQLARLHGAVVIGTVSSRNLESAGKLGLDKVIDYTNTPFEDAAGEVDLVFDTAGGERLQRSAAIIRPGGRLVSVATEPPKELTAARGIEAIYFVVEPNGQQLAELAKLVDGGQLKPVVDSVYPLTAARQAFERSLSNRAAGKVVLRIAENPQKS